MQLSLISHLNIEPPDNTANKLQMNSDQSEIWFSAIYSPNLLSVWQIHFEFEHFIATVPISVILISNYQITLQLNFKLSVINLKFEFNAINAPNLLSVWKYTSNLNISLQLSLISHLNIETPDNTANKLQMNSDQSEIWFCAIYSPNLLSVWQIHFEFEHFNAIVPISVILI